MLELKAKLVETWKQSVLNWHDVRALLHRDDPQVVFFADPHQEGLRLVVKDASALWPVSIESPRFLIFVAFLEQKMVLDQVWFLLAA
jgi:hypothetical protein